MCIRRKEEEEEEEEENRDKRTQSNWVEELQKR
jgi:hypothetical protein